MTLPCGSVPTHGLETGQKPSQIPAETNCQCCDLNIRQSDQTHIPLPEGCQVVTPPATSTSITKLSTVMKMLAKKAVQNPEIVKPRTIAETRSNISALITKRKKPSVTNVNGRVRTINSGLTTALAKPSNSAEMISEKVFENLIPRNAKLASQSDKDVMLQWSRDGGTESSICRSQSWVTKYTVPSIRKFNYSNSAPYRRIADHEMSSMMMILRERERSKSLCHVGAHGQSEEAAWLHSCRSLAAHLPLTPDIT